MSSRREPEAEFDVLWLARSFEGQFDWMFEVELHLFAFLAAMVSRVRAQPFNWSYEFVATSSRLPYAGSIGVALDSLSARGSIAVSGDKVAIAELGRGELLRMERLVSYERRSDCLEQALNLTLLSRLTEIRSLVMSLPSMTRISELKTARSLEDVMPSRGDFDQVLDLPQTTTLLAWLQLQAPALETA